MLQQCKVEVFVAGVRPAVLEMLERCSVLGTVLDASNVFVGVHDAVLTAERVLLAIDDTGGRDSPGSSLLLDSSGGLPSSSSAGAAGALAPAPVVDVAAAGGVGVGVGASGDTRAPTSALGGQPCLIDLSETDSDMASPSARNAPATVISTSAGSKAQ